MHRPVVPLGAGVELELALDGVAVRAPEADPGVVIAAAQVVVAGLDRDLDLAHVRHHGRIGRTQRVAGGAAEADVVLDHDQLGHRRHQGGAAGGRRRARQHEQHVPARRDQGAVGRQLGRQPGVAVGQRRERRLKPHQALVRVERVRARTVAHQDDHGVERVTARGGDLDPPLGPQHVGRAGDRRAQPGQHVGRLEHLHGERLRQRTVLGQAALPALGAAGHEDAAAGQQQRGRVVAAVRHAQRDQVGRRAGHGVDLLDHRDAFVVVVGVALPRAAEQDDLPVRQQDRITHQPRALQLHARFERERLVGDGVAVDLGLVPGRGVGVVAAVRCVAAGALAGGAAPEDHHTQRLGRVAVHVDVDRQQHRRALRPPGAEAAHVDLLVQDLVGRGVVEPQERLAQHRQQAVGRVVASRAAGQQVRQRVEPVHARAAGDLLARVAVRVVVVPVGGVLALARVAVDEVVVVDAEVLVVVVHARPVVGRQRRAAPDHQAVAVGQRHHGRVPAPVVHLAVAAAAGPGHAAVVQPARQSDLVGARRLGVGPDLEPARGEQAPVAQEAVAGTERVPALHDRAGADRGRRRRVPELPARVLVPDVVRVLVAVDEDLAVGHQRPVDGDQIQRPARVDLCLRPTRPRWSAQGAQRQAGPDRSHESHCILPRAR